MTAAALEPATAIAEAIRELVDAVRQLVEPDTDDPGVLDELSRLIGRARRRVNKAKKATEEPAAAPAAAKPAPTAAPTAKGAVEVLSAKARVTPAVTATIPATTSHRPAPTGEKPATPGVPMSQPQLAVVQAQQPRRRPLRRLILGAVLVTLAITVIILLAGCSSGTAGSAPTSTSVAASPKLTTLTLGADSATPQFTSVSYTCSNGGAITVCGEPLGAQLWTKQITVPVGTTVHIQVSKGGPLPPSCFIADRTRQLTYDESDTGDCQAVAEEN